MSRSILKVLLPFIIGIATLSGCASMGDGIPPEKLGEYAQIVSRVGMYGSNMDTLPRALEGRENTAYISWINGKSIFPARASMNILPGEYDFQLGMRCDNSATCRPGQPYKLFVKAGYRYVLTPEGVLVSDRIQPRNGANEHRYQQ